MQTIYVSNKGEDKNNGLTSETPVLSWKRLQVLCKGNQAMFLMEGKATLTRLRYELDEGVLHYGISVHTKAAQSDPVTMIRHDENGVLLTDQQVCELISSIVT